MAVELRGDEMRRAVSYVSVVLGWFVLVSAVALGGGVVWGLIHNFGGVDLWRTAALFFVLIACGVGAYLVIRWARSAVGSPGGSLLGRLVLGLVLLVFVLMTDHDPDPKAPPTVNDASLGIAAGLALFGAALIIEVSWHQVHAVRLHRRSRVGASATLPNAPTARRDSPAPSDIALPDPPPESPTP